MCTLTYIPRPSGFTFTHNRDERMDRPTSSTLSIKELDGQKLYCPEDLEAHGTWMAFSDKGTVACLMNGGSIPHERKLPYRHSRGLVVLDSFNYDSVPNFYEDYNFENLEPFTLVIRDQLGLWRLTHNEGETELLREDKDSPNIWASTTLYTPEIRARRRSWFGTWLQKSPVTSPKSMRIFHQTAGDGDTENDLVMSRWGLLKTLSITQFSLSREVIQYSYHDLIHETEDAGKILLRK